MAAVGAAATAVGAAFAVTAHIARLVVTPPQTHDYDIRIRGRDTAHACITLARTPDTILPGRYGLWFDDDAGYLRVAEVLRSGTDTVTRALERVDFGVPRTAADARWSGYYFLSPEELGLPVHSVAIPGPLGQLPAWLFPADGPREQNCWVVVVHGRAAERQEGLRAVPVLHELGYSALLVSYRNDGDAPHSADGRYGLGGTEWHDVEAAIAFALAHGAASVVLMGWSMGGAIALQTLTRSAHEAAITAVVLDSPVIDWVDTLEFQATLLHVPPVLAAFAMRMLGARWGRRLTGQNSPIDLPSLDFVARAAELHVPILILHSDDDGYVPATGSRRLAQLRPDIVTLVSFRRARHTRLWNYDPERWNAAIRDWLRAL
jgi:pimeloyl-ACP methyl ester carboxylesterase